MNVLPLLESAGTEGSMWPMLLIYAALFGFMYFVLIRPQRKRQKETEMLQKSIEVGDPVLLTSGMYGKIVDAVNDILVIELGTNKSVRVPMQRSAVVSKAEPDMSIAKSSSDDE